ncbi:RNA-binding domain-containing protein [Leptospira kmetyi]|uniref:Schlafen AlbA-2 domain-containing protein n=1 Tax=Leptospira kmetyi TaxID=408139 RepID=A0ABX4N7V9_9LEPT|nr:RNA-binding domain-containing protein [Leptospira kmetyi]PJZ29477.1 hypothetical protein CH378_12350 [Leptospira kmetyi]
MKQKEFENLLKKIEESPSESFESEILEFKEFNTEKSLFNSNDLIEEIVALANKKGGNIIIGVRDSSNIINDSWQTQLVGFDQIDISKAIERLKGKVQPKIDLDLIERSYKNKNYLDIQIPLRRDQLFATSSGKYYIREGKSSRPMTPGEIENHVKSMQSYDWSAQSLELIPEDALDPISVAEAIEKYKIERNIHDPLSHEQFFESIGVTKNGILTKGGFLFLGKSKLIQAELGLYEFRFSWKTKSGDLKINKVWTDNIWNSIKIGKDLFKECNENNNATFKGKTYPVPLLDEIAFHEAYLNALVHRDYSVEGMVSVTFFDKKLIITSPGDFYGGITPQNILHHEPRHRNKELAHILMTYHLVDRAGMGIFRMGIRSLMYGRKFPVFRISNNSVEVIMQGEFFIAPIFVLTQENPDAMGIIEMLILNIIYEVGFISIADLMKRLKVYKTEPWQTILDVMNNPELNKVVEFAGTKGGLFIKVKDAYLDYLKVSKKFRESPVNDKHVKLYMFLMKHGSATNVEIGGLLKYRYPSQTSSFLRNLEYAKKVGKASKTQWVINS